MQIPFGMLLNNIEIFLLIFVRMTGMFVIAPIFGHKGLPVYFKIGFAFTTSLVMANVVRVDHLIETDSFALYALYILKEFMTGVVIGFIAYAIFTSIYLAGQIIDFQIGFGMVNVFDPMSNIQIPITANLYYIMTMMIFLVTNGHHMLIKALYMSYQIVPLGSGMIGPKLGDNITSLFGQIFSMGIRIAGPILAAIFIADVVLGVISKTIPQINVFVLGMPLKITVGLFIILITIPAFVYIVASLTDSMNTEIIKFLNDMRG